jgi:nucleoside-diphosphate-sugar epimerase
MSAILVTGGCGFIGSHLIDKLLSQRKQVVCVDNLNDFYHPEIKLLNQKSHLDYKRYSFHKGDIRDKAFMREMFTTYSFDIVIHLAAMAGVRPSLDDPVHYTDVNINGTQVLLEEMKQKEIQHFIFASSSSVYGNNDKILFLNRIWLIGKFLPMEQPKKWARNFVLRIPTFMKYQRFVCDFLPFTDLVSARKWQSINLFATC